jgi:hypothetical protein
LQWRFLCSVLASTIASLALAGVVLLLAWVPVVALAGILTVLVWVPDVANATIRIGFRTVARQRAGHLFAIVAMLSLPSLRYLAIPGL